MVHALTEVFVASVVPRVVLLVNHVLASEPVATERLRGHTGRQLALRLDNWPALLPALPASRFLITPAGLLEWLEWVPPLGGGGANGGAAVADLEIAVDAGNPAWLVARSLLGRRPAVSVSGDARLAADVSWVVDNVRWDIRDDLSRLLGDWPARELARSGSALADALRTAVQGLMRRAAGRRSAQPAEAADGADGGGGGGEGLAPTPRPPAR